MLLLITYFSCSCCSAVAVAITGYSRWGTGGGLGIFGTVLLIVLIVYLVGGIR